MNQQYETDFYAWTNHQTDLLKQREFEKLDIQRLIEEIESLGSSERNRLRNHLKILLIHMLKKSFQPAMRTKSWDLSIENANEQANDVLAENPSLKPELKQILKKSYSYAMKDTAIETGLDINIFPKECPWGPEEIFTDLEKKYY
jgi:hypothetical protein